MSPLVSQGIELAVYGMGVVFVFLTMLVLAIMLMSRVIAAMGVPETPAPIPGRGTADGKKMAAIAAAVHQHRTRQP